MGQAKSRSKATSTATDQDLEDESIRLIHEAGVGVGQDHPDNRQYKFGNPSEKLNESQLAALKTFIEECERLGVKGLIAQFEKELMKWQPWTGMEYGPCVQAQHKKWETNRRGVPIWCLNETRVVLRGPNRDFINANIVQKRKAVAGMPGAPFLNKYICAMAPITTTMEDFWAMVVQQNVAYILMLSDSCENYYPTKIYKAMNFGDIQVTCEQVGYMSNVTCEMMIFSVKSRGNNFNTVFVHHYRWMKWDEFGSVPICAQPALQLLEKSRASKLTTLIHCRKGTGRTGTFIAAEYIIELIMQGKKVELVEVVKDIRRQRAQLIETGIQYCYVVLILYRFYTEATRVGSSNTKTPEDEGYLKFCTEMNDLDSKMPQTD